MPNTGEVAVDKGKAKAVPSTDHASTHEASIGDMADTDRGSADDATASNYSEKDAQGIVGGRAAGTQVSHR